MKKTLLFFLPFLLLTASYADPAEKNIFDSFFTGNDAEFIRQTSAFVASNPQLPQTHFYLRDLFNTARIGGSDAAVSTMRSIQKNIPAGNPSFAILHRRIESFCDDLEFRSRKGKGSGFVEKYKPILRWNVSSPFRKFGNGDLDHKFEPEFSFSKMGVTDSRSLLVRERSGFVRPVRYLYPAKGVAYFSTPISSSGTRIFRIESNSEYECFINGSRVLSNRYNKIFRNVRNLEVTGAESILLSIKIDLSDEAAFRVTIMDSSWNPISPSYASLTGDRKNEEICERNDPPFDDLDAAYKKDQSSDAALHLGWFYSEYDDLEALRWYERSLHLNENPAVRAIYASECERLGILYNRLSIEIQGKEEFESLARRFPNCVPASNAVLRETFRYGSRIESIKRGRDRIRSGADFDAYDEICSYLEASGEKYFLAEAAAEFSKAFPLSTVPLLYQSKSLSEGDPAGALSLCRRYLAAERSESVAAAASQLMSRTGDYSGYSLMEEYIDEPSAPAAFSSATMMINAGKYAEARILLLKIAAEKDDPKVYEAIGRLKILSGSSPDMFWGKAVSLEPSSRFPMDFLMNKAEGKSLPLLNNLRDAAAPVAIEKSFTDGKTIDGTVLYRSSIFKMFSSRSGRYFFEEIIYLRNSADIDRYGEYRIPFDKNLSIVQCTLLSRDGTRSESYAHHTVDGEQYLTVTGLSPEHLLHVAYEVDNYSPVLSSSALLCSGSIFINGYDEEVKFFTSVIEVPIAIQLSFSSSGSVSILKNEYDKSIIWTVRAENIPAVHKESHVPSPEKNLKWFSFTESESYEDLFEWYRGQWPVKTISRVKAISGTSKEETVRKVYEYLSRSITLEERDLFSPEPPDDLLFKGKGSSEDKVFCARAMLFQQGINSYPALSLRKGASSGFQQDSFNSVMLYVPDEKSTGTWLDFSMQYCPAGTLSSSNENARVFILSDDGAAVEKIAHSAMKSEEKFISEMIIGADGSSECNVNAVYSGRNAVLEKFSGDDRYREELAGFIAADFHSRIILSDIQFPDKKNYGEIVVSMKGKIPGFALIGSTGVSLKPFFHPTSVPEYLSGSSRISPLFISEEINTDEQCVIKLPEGVEPATVSFSQSVSFSHGAVTYSVSKEKGSRSLIVKRITFFPECVIEPENYGEFLRFCTKLRSIEQMRIVVPWK